MYFANFNEKIATNENFNNLIIMCIIFAGALVGLQTYEGMEEATWVIIVDSVILVLFTLECMFKFFAEGIAFWRFFTGPEWRWNNFDLAIVVACMPMFKNTALGQNVVVLRLLRLMRLAKVFRKIPQLQMIVMGLVGGMKSISYIVLLLFIVFYLYAIIGILAFRANDPFHWQGLQIALMTLWRMATLEDWTDVMYINIFGCDVYTTGGGITYCDIASDDCSNLIPSFSVNSKGEVYEDEQGFPAVAPALEYDWLPVYTMDCFVEDCSGAVENITYSGIEYAIRPVFNSGTSRLSNFTMSDSQVLCQYPSPSFYMAPLYFISFIVVSALVMLSLFVGAVTMAMSESMEGMKADADEKDRLRRLEKGRQAALELQKTSMTSMRSMRSSRNINQDSKEEEEEEEEEAMIEDIVTGKAAREKAKMKALLMSAWDGSEVKDFEVGGQFTGWKKDYAKFASVMEKITEDARFTNFVTFIILLAGIQVGVNTYKEFSAEHADVLFVADQIISFIFTAEIVMKIIACEFEPWLFFNSGWNKFDFVIVVGGFFGDLLPINLNILRLLRLLRVLKLVNKLPQLQVIVVALMMGVSSIGYIGVILFIFFYFFAIIGMIFFSQNDPWHFGSLHMTMLTLFRASTLEDWTDIMYINTYGCRIFGYSDTMNQALNGKGCGHPDLFKDGAGQSTIDVTWKGAQNISSFYFFVFIMLGALVLLTLFVGVVTTSMEEATEDMKEAQEIEAEVQRVAKEEGLTVDQVEMYRVVFGILDLDGGGSIEEDELKVGLDAIGRRPTDRELKSMLLEVDESGDGEVDFAEFLQFMMVVKRKQAARLSQRELPIDESDENSMEEENN